MTRKIAGMQLGAHWGLDDWPDEIHVSHEFAPHASRTYLPEKAPEKTKVCPRCKRELPLSEFSPDRSKAKKVRTYCRACWKEYMREYRKAPRPAREERLYALYQGDEIQVVGTVAQLAEWQGCTEQTIRWYATPSNISRNGHGIAVYPIRDEEAV